MERAPNPLLRQVPEAKALHTEQVRWWTSSLSMQLHSVATTGSALAACLRTVATSGQGFGFLIGKSSFPKKALYLKFSSR